jgi:hypothetical protein
LFAPGQPLDATRYFLIIPDIIGFAVPASRATACGRDFRIIACTTSRWRSTEWSLKD